MAFLPLLTNVMVMDYFCVLIITAREFPVSVQRSYMQTENAGY